MGAGFCPAEPRSDDASGDPATGGDQKPFDVALEAVNCHHNYVQKEQHFGEDVLVTRKGAVSAQKGELGIIPGSMGAKSFIVRGLGNEEAFCSCSHGAGRVMSRTKAKNLFTVEDQIRATAHVECRKDRPSSMRSRWPIKISITSCTPSVSWWKCCTPCVRWCV